jgi:hypothetical protein
MLGLMVFNPLSDEFEEFEVQSYRPAVGGKLGT